MQIEFFFDCSSPWTYLAFENIQTLAVEFNAQIIWKPFLVGGLFNAVNPGVEFFKAKDKVPQRKIDYYMKDMADWARFTGLTIHFPPAGHPVNSVKVMRGCLLLQPSGKLVPFARAAFQAYFGEERLISDDIVIADLCRSVDVDPIWLLARIADPDMKEALKAHGEEAIRRGAFGSPTMFLDGDDMYFGVDRLQLMRQAMIRKSEAQTRP